jgi:ABC-type Mn2+/Zn2+ transport system ATPase subunit
VAGLLGLTRGALDVPARQADGGVSLVLQATEHDAVLPITVRDVVRMARYRRLGMVGRFRSADRLAVESAIERLELTPLVGRQLGELSGGQRQRVLVAQGLAQDADLLLLDEPLTGLDIASRDRILAIVDGERAAGRTVMMSTHDLGDARRCDHVMLMSTRLIAFGTPDVVFDPFILREAYGDRVVGLDESAAVLLPPTVRHRPPSSAARVSSAIG